VILFRQTNGQTDTIECITSHFVEVINIVLYNCIFIDTFILYIKQCRARLKHSLI